MMGFREELDRTEAVQILPWVGADYAPGSGVLMVCEAHYRDKEHTGDRLPVGESDRRFTRDLVRGYFDNATMRYRFTGNLLGLANSLFFGSISPPETVASRIAYYNFVQFFMGARNEAPRPEEVASSFDAMDEVLRLLSPAAVIVCGISRNRAHLERYLSARRGRDVRLPFRDSSGVFLNTHHPSWRFFSIERETAQVRARPEWAWLAERMLPGTAV